MVELGEIKRGIDIGYKTTNKYIWAACIDCGKERWSIRFHGEVQNPRCQKCNGVLRGLSVTGEKHPRWIGGKTKDGRGYIRTRIYPDNFYFPMVRREGWSRKGGRYVLEHRLVMAQQLGRCLQEWETVHHKNGVKTDNRIENLELCGSIGEHIREHNKGYKDGFQKGYYDGKDKLIIELKNKIKQLKMS